MTELMPHLYGTTLYGGFGMIEINLEEHGGRVVNLAVTDKHGEVYKVMMEFVAHDYDVDDVQISVHKLPKDWKERMKAGSCPIYPANDMIHNDKAIDKRSPGGYMLGNVWYEFHDVGEMPAVRSDAGGPTASTMFSRG